MLKRCLNHLGELLLTTIITILACLNRILNRLSNSSNKVSKSKVRETKNEKGITVNNHSVIHLCM